MSSMRMKTLLEIVQDIAEDQLNLDRTKVVPSARFLEDLGADSLDVVELVMAIELKFDIEADDVIVGKITKVQHVLDYVYSNQRKYEELPEYFESW